LSSVLAIFTIGQEIVCLSVIRDEVNQTWEDDEEDTQMTP